MKLYDNDGNQVSKIGNVGLVICTLLGLACWIGLFALVGCGPTKEQASMMTGGQLVFHHFREIDIMDRADMDVVNEIVSRGGFPQWVADDYAKGARLHDWRTTEQWGQRASDLFDWEAMGYANHRAVMDDPAWGGLSSGNASATVYGRSGTARLYNYGGGVYRVRTTGR